MGTTLKATDANIAEQGVWTSSTHYITSNGRANEGDDSIFYSTQQSYLFARGRTPLWLLPFLLLTLALLPSLVSAYVGTPTVGVSNVMLDGSQYLNLTAYSNNAVTSFTYNIIASNTATGAVIASNQMTTSATQGTWIWQVPTSATPNSISVNVIVTNGASTTANSIKTSLITLSNQFQNTWTASNSVMTPGQTEVLTASITGGTNSITVGNFNGASSYINTGSTSLSPEATGNEQFTECAWFYLNSLTGPQAILFKGLDAPSSGNGYEYEMLLTAGQVIRGIVWNAAGQTITSASTSFIPNTGQWYHFCFTYDYLNQLSYGYINGVQITGVGPWTPYGPATAGTGNVIIGDRGTGYFNGQIADVQLYNTTLTYAQVNTLYAEGITGAPPTFNGLIAWWDLNGPSSSTGANVMDYSYKQDMGTPTSMLYSTSYNAFTYNMLVYASNGLLMTSLKTNVLPNTENGISSTSNTLKFSTTGWVAGTYTANLIITDSATTQNVITNTLTFTINNALAFTSLTSSPSLPSSQAAGNTITFTSSWAGGSSTFTANYILSNSVAGFKVYYTLNSISSSPNTLTITLPTAWIGNTITANVIITDSSSETVNSIPSNSLTIISAPSLSVSTSYSPTLVVIGQGVTLKASASSGTPPYTYQWYSNSACTSAIGGATSSSYTFVIENTISYCISVKDSATPTNSVVNSIVSINDPEIVYSTDKYQAYELASPASNSLSFQFQATSANMFAVLAVSAPTAFTLAYPSICTSTTSQTLANILVCGSVPMNALSQNIYTLTYSSTATQNVSIGAFMFSNRLISTYSTNSASGFQTGISFPQFAYTYICTAEVASNGNGIILNPGITDYYLTENSVTTSHNEDQNFCNTNATLVGTTSELSGIGLYETVNPYVHYINGVTNNVIINAGPGLSVTNTVSTNTIQFNNLNISLSALSISGANGISSTHAGFIWTIGPTATSIGNSYLTGPLLSSLTTTAPLTATNPGSGTGAAYYTLGYTGNIFLSGSSLNSNEGITSVTAGNPGITVSCSGASCAVTNNGVIAFNTNNGYVTGVATITGANGILSTGTSAVTISNYLSSNMFINSLSQVDIHAVGLTGITAGNYGITVSCSASSCAVTNNGVLQFNTANGVVTGVGSFDGQTGSVTGVSNINGVSNAITMNTLGGFSITNTITTNTITLANTNKTGSGTSYSAGNGISISASNVISANAIAPLTANTYGIGISESANVFTNSNNALDILTSQFIKAINNGNFGVNVVCTSQTCSITNNGVLQYNGNNGIVSSSVNTINAGNSGIVVSCVTGTCSITNNGVLQFNSNNGVVTGVSSFDGQTGAVIGVNSINGVANAVIMTFSGGTITNTITTNTIALSVTISSGVTSLNGQTGAVVISAGTATTNTVTSGVITIGNSGVTTITGSGGFTCTASSGAITCYSPVYTAGTGIGLSAANVISNGGVTAFDTQTGNVIGVSSINGVSNAITTNTVGGFGVGNFISANILQFINNNVTAIGYVKSITSSGAFTCTSTTGAITCYSPAYTGGNYIQVSATNVINSLGVWTFDAQTGNVIGVGSINGVANAITLSGTGGFAIANSISTNTITGYSPIYTGSLPVLVSTSNVISLGINPVLIAFYETNTVSPDIPGNFVQSFYPINSITNTLINNVVDGEDLQNFVTNASVPSSLFIPAGEYLLRQHAAVQNTIGFKTVTLYAKIWQVSSTGALGTLLGTTTLTNPLTSLTPIQQGYNLTFFNYNTISTKLSDRLETQIYASITGSGAAPNVILTSGGISDSQVEIPYYIKSINTTGPLFITVNGTLGLHFGSGLTISNNALIAISSSAQPLTYYMQNTNSNVTGYNSMLVTPYSTFTTLMSPALPSNSNTLIGNWITPTLNEVFLPPGTYSYQTYASQTGGGSTVYVYGQIWEVTSNGIPVNEIGQTTFTTGLTGTEQQFNLTFVDSNTYTLQSSNSRIELRAFGQNQASNPVISLYIGGTASAHLSIPSPALTYNTLQFSTLNNVLSIVTNTPIVTTANGISVAYSSNMFINSNNQLDIHNLSISGTQFIKNVAGGAGANTICTAQVCTVYNLNLSASGYVENVLAGAGILATRSGNTITVNSLNLSRVVYTCASGCSISAANAITVTGGGGSSANYIAGNGILFTLAGSNTIISFNALLPLTSNTYGAGLYYTGNLFQTGAGALNGNGLVGPQGPQGNQGPTGGTGAPGAPGAPGTSFTCGNGLACSASNVISVNAIAPITSNSEGVGLANTGNTFVTPTGYLNSLNSGSGGTGIYTAGTGIYISPANVISNIGVNSLNGETGNLAITGTVGSVSITTPTSNTINVEATNAIASSLTFSAPLSQTGNTISLLFSNPLYLLSNSLTSNAASSGKGTIFVNNAVLINGENMLGYLFAIIALVFMVLRFIRWETSSLTDIILETLSGIFMAVAIYFLIFPILPTAATNVNIFNGSSQTAANTLYSMTSNSTVNSGPKLNSPGIIPIFIVFFLWVTLVIIMILRDAPGILFPKKWDDSR